jgi:hypothetical protein
MFLKETGDFNGSCDLKPYKNEEKTLEMGYYIRPDY